MANRTGNRFDRHEHQNRYAGHAMVTVHREARRTELLFGGSKQDWMNVSFAALAKNWDSTGPNYQGRKAECENLRSRLARRH